MAQKSNTMTRFVEEGRYHKFIRKPASKTLLIVFSHLASKPPRFGWYKMLQNVDANLLFVNSDGFDWYRAGILSLAEPGLQNTIEAILSLARHLSPNTAIYTCGASMGGYGALLYGALLKAKGIFSCAAETILRVPGGRSTSLRDGQWSHVYPDLRVVSQIPVRRHVFFGEMCLIDTLCAALYAGVPATELYSIDSGTHGASNLLHKRGQLVPAIKAMVAGNPDLFADKVYDTGLSTAPILHEIGWQLNWLMEKREFSTALPVAERLARETNHHPAALFLLGQCEFRLHNNDVARRHFELLAQLRPDCAPAPINLGVLASRRGDFERALEYINQSLTLDPNPSMTYFQRGLVLEKLGRMQDAVLDYQKESAAVAQVCRDFSIPPPLLRIASITAFNSSTLLISIPTKASIGRFHHCEARRLLAMFLSNRIFRIFAGTPPTIA